jgi:hypothetical protein
MDMQFLIGATHKFWRTDRCSSADDAYAVLLRCVVCVSFTLGMVACQSTGQSAPSAVIAPSTVPAPRSATEPTTSIPKINVIPYTKAAYVPASWQREPFNFYARTPTDDQMAATLNILARGFTKYPSPVLADNLSDIVVCACITVRNTALTGTNSRHNVYLVCCNGTGVVACAGVEFAFHHEVSSILLRNYSTLLDAKAWQQNNAADMAYGTSTYDFQRTRPHAHRLDYEYAAKGFVSDYARCTFEDDVNETSAYLFSGDVDFWLAVDRYPRLRAKVSLLVKMYHGINDQFTEEYFRALKN